MNAQVDVINLAVEDLDTTRRFYVEGLGWTPLLDAPEAVCIQVGHGVMLALYPRSSADTPVGNIPRKGRGFTITLGHLVGTDAAVVRILRRAEAAGGVIVAGGASRSWGGFSGWFADPDGYCWEVAHNPAFSVDDAGRISLSPGPQT